MAEETTTPTMDPAEALQWGITAVICVIYAIWGDFKDLGYTPGVMGRIVIAVFMIPGGMYGIRIGRWFRNMMVPDFVMTSSVGGLVKEKLFWSFGPQLIGWFIGISAGGYVALYLMKLIFG